MLPPNDSSDSNISSADRFVVDLNASRSTMWLTPRRSSFSNLDPASMYTPTPEKWPGSASVATLMPFCSVVIRSSSVGSFADDQPMDVHKVFHKAHLVLKTLDGRKGPSGYLR